MAVPCESLNNNLLSSLIKRSRTWRIRKATDQGGVFWNSKIELQRQIPGSDEFTVEFYLHFWSILGEEMIQSFNQTLTHGHLNITKRQGIIRVVPKKRKNKLYLENWRPISLLNTDYKIATKTIASRISKVLPKLIHEDQTRYVKDRNIGQNIRLVKDIMKIMAIQFHRF